MSSGKLSRKRAPDTAKLRAAVGQMTT